MCRQCYQKWYRTSTPERLAKRTENNKRWNEGNPTRKYMIDRWNQLFRYYGVTKEQYQSLFAQQSGVCAICGSPPKVRGKQGLPFLCVDHNHTTGQVRGLLCDTCNRGIGYLQDDLNIVLKAGEYLTLWQKQESN